MDNKEKELSKIVEQQVKQQNNEFEYIKIETPTERKNIFVKDSAEPKALAQLENRSDIKALRIKKLLSLPDLSRTEKSPVKFVADKIVGLPRFKDFDVVTIPETITVKNNFDLFNFPLDHPSRKETDTYFVNNDRVLCTQTTAMWAYYLKHPEIRNKLKERGWLGASCYGKTYRKDEIDRTHYPAFHQIDGLYICEKKRKIITLDDLVDVLADIAKGVFGSDVKYKVFPDTFPYTDPSTQMAIEWKGEWLEVLGAGIVRQQIYPNFNLDPAIYNGWAFGFGLDRLAMIKMGIPDIRILWSTDERIARQFKNIDSQYQEVSKYPATYRDISFIVDKNTSLNNYYEIIRDQAGDLIEEVKLIDQYKDEKKFGKDKISYTFRIVYRSHERTLENKEINEIQGKIREKTQQELNAVLR